MSSPIDDGGSAFPQAIPPGFIGAGCGPHVEFGMSLRDVFACAALQGIWSQTKHEDGNNELLSWSSDVYLHQAYHCYEMADAMLEARAQKGGVA